jgi:hypothetical protein
VKVIVARGGWNVLLCWVLPVTADVLDFPLDSHTQIEDKSSDGPTLEQMEIHACQRRFAFHLFVQIPAISDLD